MNGRRRRHADRGFTMIEVMLAIAIMVMLTATLWGAFSRTATIKQRASFAQDRTHTVRVALMRMSREIEMAFLSDSENPFLPERRTMFVSKRNMDIDHLQFSWFGHQRLRADAAEADTAVVSYYGEPDPTNRRYMNLMRRETRRLEAKDPSAIPGEAYVLCPFVVRLQFSFYDFKNKAWREDWDTMGSDGRQYLPTHVRIALTVIDERGEEVTYTSAARVQMTERVGYRPGAS